MTTVEETSWCPNGWETRGGRERCNYTGYCYCIRGWAHPTRCQCACGSTKLHPSDCCVPFQLLRDEVINS